MLWNVYFAIDDKWREGNFPKTSYRHNEKACKKLNDNGRGIYCSVNDFEATEEEMKKEWVKTKRNIQFLSKINWVYLDFDIAKKWDWQDELDKEHKKDLAIMDLLNKCEPSIVLSTANGLQPIWKLKNTNTSEEYQARYLHLMESMITRSKTIWSTGDQVKDVTRVLRLPWYNHMKEEPYMVKKVIETDKEYTIEQLEKIFVKQEIKAPVMKAPISNAIPPMKKLEQYDVINDLDFFTVIEKAFSSVGRTVELDKQDRLIIDGRLTWTFIGKRWDRRYIASTSHEPFKWNIITVVSDILQLSNKESYKWLIENFGIKEKVKEVKKVAKKKEIKESVEWNFRHIDYYTKIAKWYEELIDTDPSKIMKRWWQERDDLLWWIYWGKIILVGASTWIWKSTFINQVCRNVGRTWIRVVKYSLEDRMEDSAKEEIFYETNRQRFKDGRQKYERTKFVNNEYWDDEFLRYITQASEILAKENVIELEKTKQVNIEELVLLMEEECKKWAKLFAIDHLHYFEFEDSKERLDLHIQNVMHNINEVARKYNVAVLLVAHYKNNTPLWSDWIPNSSWFKDGASIKQVANIIIQIERDYEDNISYFHITKMRGPIIPTVLETQFDVSTYEYSFQRTKAQIEKEKKF